MESEMPVKERHQRQQAQLEELRHLKKTVVTELDKQLVGDREAYFNVKFPLGWTILIEVLHENLAKLDPGYRLHKVRKMRGQLEYVVSPSSNEYLNRQFRAVLSGVRGLSTTICIHCGLPASRDNADTFDVIFSLEPDAYCEYCWKMLYKQFMEYRERGYNEPDTIEYFRT